MLRFLPGRWSVRWLYVGGLYLLLLWDALLLNRSFVLTTSMNVSLALRLLLLSLIFTLIVNGAGWAGARLIWLFSTLGIIIGLAFMFKVAGEQSGWEDLIGFFTFITFTAFGLGAGIILEAAAWLYRRLQK